MVSWSSLKTVPYALAGKVTKHLRASSSTVLCKRSTYPLLWDVKGAERVCLTLVASHKASNSPLNSVPLSVLTLSGFPNT
jgi:hypothetical protein